MVVDTSDTSFFGITDNDSLGLRNVLAHEHGHALGLNHVMPVDETKLMEPYVSYAFNGPQPDSDSAANRGYGDRFEKGVGNDTIGDATVLGPINSATPITTSQVSIDGTSDTDFYKFTIGCRGRLSASLQPAGTSYMSGSQFGDPPTLFDAKSQNDLAIAIVAANGTIIASANSAGLGVGETLSNVSLPAAGDYYVRVTGSIDTAQMYSLGLTAAEPVIGAHLVHVDSSGTVTGIGFGSHAAVAP